MRLLELKNLLEAVTLTPSELIKPNATTNVPRIDIFTRKVDAGEPFLTTDGREVIIDKSESKRIRDIITQRLYARKSILVNTDQGPIKLSDLKKTGEFGAQAGDVENKISNRGDISEGILGAALFAKMRARVNGKIKTISASDIWGVVDSLQLQKIVRAKNKNDIAAKEFVEFCKLASDVEDLVFAMDTFKTL